MVSADSLVRVFNMIALLAMGHCLADYPLQTDRIALEKCKGCDLTLNWRWWLSAHAGVHALLVALITGSPLLGVGEWVLHIAIDHGKCMRLYNITVDQSLHLACKLLWAMLAIFVLQVGL
jgi:hypothetical protein